MNVDPISLIKHALKIGAMELLPKGRILRSKRRSPYFFNAGKFANGQDISLLCEAYSQTIFPNRNLVQALYGPSYKGIPLMTGTAMDLWKRHGCKIDIASSRKEPKDHGEGGIHIGAPLKNSGVGIIDDVITSGGSAGDSHAYITNEGGFPTMCVIAFDRKERGVGTDRSAVQEFTEKHNIPVFAISTIDHLIQVLKEDAEREVERYPHSKLVLPMIHDYHAEYGAQY